VLEKYGFYVLVPGLVLAVLAYLWVLIAAFRYRFWWGLGIFLIPPLWLLFVLLHFHRVVKPLTLLLLAAVITAIPYGINYYERKFTKLGPHVRTVDDEVRITLTGLKDYDYSALQERPETVVLQMANEDVKDETLEYLKGMSNLRRLDVSGSRITDDGLRTLAELPNLKELYLARTKITDEGFQKYLAPKESLLKLDLTGTAVKGKTKRDWKKKKPEREYVD
jgi:hypothetical protein